MKKTAKVIIFGIVILFIVVFLNRNNYYENQKVLSEEAIKQFETDIKNGKDINPNNYITKEKNYNNKASKIGKEISSVIEYLVNKSLKKVINYLHIKKNYITY